MPRLHYVLRGIKSEEAKHQAPTKQRLPVTPVILLKVYSVLQDNPSNFDNMIWAASLVYVSSASFVQEKSLSHLYPAMMPLLT